MMTPQPRPQTRSSSPYVTSAFYAIAGLLLFFGPTEFAMANVLDNLGNAILEVLNSTFLRAIAIVAVIIVGLVALRGRMDWGIALWVILGIIIIFSAAAIVDFFIETGATI
jgi:type IV secretion system protein VirB2